LKKKKQVVLKFKINNWAKRSFKNKSMKLFGENPGAGYFESIIY